MPCSRQKQQVAGLYLTGIIIISFCFEGRVGSFVLMYGRYRLQTYNRGLMVISGVQRDSRGWTVGGFNEDK